MEEENQGLTCNLPFEMITVKRMGEGNRGSGGGPHGELERTIRA